MTIKKIITDWVRENFGESEVNDPSWNIDLLAKHIETQLKKQTDERYNSLYARYKRYKKVIDEIHNAIKGV